MTKRSMVIEAEGRRYVLVPVFPAGALKSSFEGFEPDTCIECEAPVRHGFDPYFQRNDINPEPLAVGPEMVDLAAMLLEMTYDCVCFGCGQKVLGEQCPTS